MQNQMNNSGMQDPMPQIPKPKRHFRVVFLICFIIAGIAVVFSYSKIRNFWAKPNLKNQVQPEVAKSEQGLNKDVSSKFASAFIAKKSSLVLPKIGQENNVNCIELPTGLLWVNYEKISNAICKKIALENGKLAYSITGNLDSAKARMLFDDLYGAALGNGWTGLNEIVAEGFGFFELDSAKYQSRAEIQFLADSNVLKIFIFEK